jgi:hypothetical protein
VYSVGFLRVRVERGVEDRCCRVCDLVEGVIPTVTHTVVWRNSMI